MYVDDCLIFAKEDSVIDSLIKKLSQDFLLQDEGYVNTFLGVQISKDSTTKTKTFTQPHLIQQILSDVGVSSDSNGKETPVDTILHNDPDGPEQMETWNYRSVIRKLNYLANNTRLPTKDMGLMLHPKMNLSLNMHADTDFVGRWHKEYSDLRNNILSCTGYIISFCGCPDTWCSKLQSELALSTTESKYIALLAATRDLLPLR
jgi:hypothetical protein